MIKTWNKYNYLLLWMTAKKAQLIKLNFNQIKKYLKLKKQNVIQIVHIQIFPKHLFAILILEKYNYLF